MKIFETKLKKVLILDLVVIGFSFYITIGVMSWLYTPSFFFFIPEEMPCFLMFLIIGIIKGLLNVFIILYRNLMKVGLTNEEKRNIKRDILRSIDLVGATVYSTFPIWLNLSKTTVPPFTCDIILEFILILIFSSVIISWKYKIIDEFLIKKVLYFFMILIVITIVRKIYSLYNCPIEYNLLIYLLFLSFFTLVYYGTGAFRYTLVEKIVGATLPILFLIAKANEMFTLLGMLNLNSLLILNCLAFWALNSSFVFHRLEQKGG